MDVRRRQGQWRLLVMASPERDEPRHRRGMTRQPTSWTVSDGSFRAEHPGVQPQRRVAQR